MCFYIFLTGNACSSNPCLNNGQCSIIGTSYRCTCPTGYGGSQCQITTPGTTWFKPLDLTWFNYEIFLSNSNHSDWYQSEWFEFDTKSHWNSIFRPRTVSPSKIEGRHISFNFCVQSKLPVHISLYSQHLNMGKTLLNTCVYRQKICPKRQIISKLIILHERNLFDRCDWSQWVLIGCC